MGKKRLVCVATVVLVIATWLDLEYKGLFYKMLPQSIQETIDEWTILNKK